MAQYSRIGSPARSGVSLLEVLISVGVLSIGLLGVAAVIPLGHHNMTEAAKSDRSAACGQAGLHEVKSRGWLNPRSWRRLNAALNTIQVTDIDSDGDDDGFIQMRDSFAIDPLFFDHQDYGNDTNLLVRRFPLDASSAALGTMPWESSLVRVTVDPANNSVSPAVMPFAEAEQIFTWRDDMLFPVPEEADDRPRQMVMVDGGQGFSAPVPSGMSPVIPQGDDNYSWMATVTPTLDGPGGDYWDTTTSRWYSYVDTISHYTVSIVVFYKRDFECPTDLTDPEDPPQERSVQAFFPGDGYGGGDVLLVIDPSTTPETWLDVKKNSWLMIRGWERVNVQGTLQPRTLAEWYRVIAVDDETVPGNFSTTDSIPDGDVGRYVTLSGPDWRIDTNGDGTFQPLVDWAIATLVDDVIGVYTTTVEAGL